MYSVGLKNIIAILLGKRKRIVNIFLLFSTDLDEQI